MYAFGRSVAFGLAIVVGMGGAARGADNLCADMTAWPFGAGERMVPGQPTLPEYVCPLPDFACEH